MRVSGTQHTNEPRGVRALARAALCALLAVVLAAGLVPAVPRSAQAAPVQPAQSALVEPAEPGDAASGDAASGDAARDPSVPSSAEMVASVPEHELADDQLIVVYKDQPAQLEGPAGEQLEEAGVVEQSTVAPAGNASGAGAITAVRLDEGVSPVEAAQALEASDAVDYVVPNQTMQLMDTQVNDPFGASTAEGYYSQPYLGMIKAYQAWDYTRVQGCVTVAVIDTGCRATHQDLSGVVDRDNAYDVLKDSKLDLTADKLGHGTAVAGIMAAEADNRLGMAGVSYNARVLPINVFNPDTREASTADVVKAYEYLFQHQSRIANLRVINLSLGYYPSAAGIAAYKAGRDPLANAIKRMRDEHGVLTVCAGGNGVNHQAVTSTNYPSDYDEALAVTAVTEDGAESVYSDYNEYKDISAPGDQILYTSSVGTSMYMRGEGTSYASPMVAGLAALLWAYKPQLSVNQVVNAMQSTATPIEGKHPTNASVGCIDMAAALNAVSDYRLEFSSSARHVYTGKAITPGVTVLREGNALGSGAYKLSYRNNVNAGLGTVVADSALPGQDWSSARSFTIEPRSLSAVSVGSLGSHSYTGSSIRPKPKLTYNGKTLIEGTDYLVAYRNNVDPGTATITFTGKGNFTGTRVATFAIKANSLSSSSTQPSGGAGAGGSGSSSATGVSSTTVTGINARYAYTGSPIKPVPVVRYKGKLLRQGSDYTLSYANHQNAGTASVTITGRGLYTGSKRVTYIISKLSLGKASVSLSTTAYAWDGKAKKPAPTVRLNGRILRSGVDYTVAYRNNVNAGTGTVTITGKGNYSGALSRSFTIKKPSIQYSVHRQTYGWEKQYSKRDGAQSGTTGQAKRLEGIYIRLANKPVSGSLQYRTHVQKIGWQGWKAEGLMSGTMGKSYRLEAIQVKLTGEMAKKHDVYYRVHAQRFGWMGWAKNGAQAGTAGYGYRLESIQIKLVPKGAAAPTSADGVPSTKGKAAFSQRIS